MLDVGCNGGYRMSESRDLTPVFDRIREGVYYDDLEVLLVVVHDKKTGTTEALYEGSDKACKMVEALQAYKRED